MTPDEYAAHFRADLNVADHLRARQQQTTQRILGVSDVGKCRSYAALFLSNTPFTDSTSSSQARAGSFFHAGIGLARQEGNPQLLIEQELVITLPNGFELLGHADEIDPAEPSVCDWKTVSDELAAKRRLGANANEKMQRHLYAAGAIQAGLVKPDGLIVRNIWLDRSGATDEVHVEQEPYNPAYLDDAQRFIEEVMWHVDNQTPAPRDKDFHWCEHFCPFFKACRGEQAVPDEEITEPHMIQAAALYAEGASLEKEGKELKQAAASMLDGANGRAGQFKVKTTWVAGGPVSYERKPYNKLTVKEIA